MHIQCELNNVTPHHTKILIHMTQVLHMRKSLFIFLKSFKANKK